MATALAELPGQRFTPHEQCQLIHGPESYYCGVGTPINNLCNLLLKLGEVECASVTEDKDSTALKTASVFFYKQDIYNTYEIKGVIHNS